jgi:hypothetical protein
MAFAARFVTHTRLSGQHSKYLIIEAVGRQTGGPAQMGAYILDGQFFFPTLPTCSMLIKCIESVRWPELVKR